MNLNSRVQIAKSKAARFTFVFIALLGLQVASTAVAQTVPQVRIGTGGPAGIYFVAGNAICRMVRIQGRNDPAKRLRCAAPPSGGSIENLRKLREGAIEFAIVQSDWQYHAYRGSSRFEGAGIRDLRSVLSLHVEPFQIVVRDGSDVAEWKDLIGKRVNIGNPGSGHRATFEELVRVHGQKMTGFAAVSELGSSDQAAALCAGKIDAFAFTVGVPNASIAQATDGCDGRIISLQTPEVGKLVEKSGYYRWATIPEGTYFTSVDAVRTIGVVATLVTRADVDTQLVEHVVASVFKNFGRFRRLHPAFQQLQTREMTKVGLSAPLHPGALNYYNAAKLLR